MWRTFHFTEVDMIAIIRWVMYRNAICRASRATRPMTCKLFAIMQTLHRFRIDISREQALSPFLFLFLYSSLSFIFRSMRPPPQPPPSPSLPLLNLLPLQPRQSIFLPTFIPTPSTSPNTLLPPNVISFGVDVIAQPVKTQFKNV